MYFNVIRDIFIILLLASTAFAVDWDAKYDEVCEVDASYCGRLKAADGTWLKIKPEIVQLLKDQQVQNEIKSAAVKYKVSPTAIAGAIAAENSLNVGVADRVQTFLAQKMGITKIGNKSFSVGLGQINLPAAMEAEIHTAKIEGRQPRSMEEMTQEISDPSGSIRVAAQIIRKVQDDYKDQGIDISNKPEILATLYNLGYSEERAKKAKKTGSLPTENYFGFFVKKYNSEIEEYAGISKKDGYSSSPGSGPKNKSFSASPLISKHYDLMAKDKSSNAIIKSTLKEVASRSISLTSFPDSCPEREYGQDVAEKYSEFESGAATGVLTKQTSYKIISSKFGCNTTPWVLVRSEEGAEGWVKKEILEANTERTISQISDCKEPSLDHKCQASVAKATKDFKLESKDGLIYLKPISASDNAGFDQEDFNCRTQKDQKIKKNAKKEKNRKNPMGARAALSSGVAWPTGGMGGLTNNTKSVSLKEIDTEIQSAKKISRAIDAKVDEMIKVTGLSRAELVSPENPYFSIYQTMSLKMSQMSPCFSTAQSESLSCGDIKNKEATILKALLEVKLEKNPKIDAVQNTTAALYQSFVGAQPLNIPTGNMAGLGYKVADYYAATSEEQALGRNSIEMALKDCLERRNLFQQKAAKQKPPSTASKPGINMSLGWGYLGYGGHASFELKNLVSAVLTLSDAEFEEQKSNLIAMGKFCAARLNIVNQKRDTKNPLLCTNAPKFVNNVLEMGSISHEVYLKLSEDDPAMFLLDLDVKLSSYDGNGIGQKTLTEKLNQVGMASSTFPIKNSFCPNVTAEYIEDLLTNNPCIKRVYTPSHWITKRLGNHGDKVMLREFEETDRFAIELRGGTSCEQ